MTDAFTDVTNNAFDFLARSIDELETNPKYSVIHFYSAIELFLKARLLKEHWALVVMKPDQADKSAFQKGDFQSVGLNEAADRLNRIAKDGLQAEEKTCFDSLRKERNRMIHFFHPVQSGDDAAKKTIEKIVAEQYRGWFYLHRLLVERWSDHFKDHAEEIKKIDALMRKRATYLREKFQVIEPQIAAATAVGRCFVTCPSCHYDSLEVSQPTSLGHGRCLTCQVDGYALAFKCLKCNEIMALVDSAYDSCSNCFESYEPKHVHQILDDADMLRNLNPMDMEELTIASCGECGAYETVVPMPDEWFCTDCFTVFTEEQVGQCEWCSEYSTSLPDETYLAGCSQCDGYAGHMRDKDD